MLILFTPNARYIVGTQEMYMKQLSKQMNDVECLYQITVKMQVSQVGVDKVLASISMNSFFIAVFNPQCTLQFPGVKGSFKKYGCLGSTPEQLAENLRVWGLCISIA